MKPTVERFLFAGFTANCYCLTAPNGDRAIVDVGGSSKEFLAFLKEQREQIRYYLLTHDHFDHICGLPEALKAAPAPLIIQKDDEKGLFDGSLSLCNEVGLPQPKLPRPQTVQDGEKLPFGGGFIEVLHTPGHTCGGACYLFGNLLFSGDTLFEGSVGRTDFVTGDFKKLQQSLKRLAALSKDTVIYPGHGDKTTLQKELEQNPYLTF